MGIIKLKCRRLVLLFITALLSAGLFSCRAPEKPAGDTEPSPPIIIYETEKRPETPPLTPAETPEPDAGASPDDYSVSLEYSPEEAGMTGFERLDYKNRTGMTLDKIYFNLYLNAFSINSGYKPYFDVFEGRIFTEGKSYGYMNVSKVLVGREEAGYTQRGTVLTVYFQNPVAPGESAELIIYFEAKIPRINHRTGFNAYAAWFGNFLPSLAVFDEYGWHTEPYYPAGDPFYTAIANYTVSVSAPQGYTVVGTVEESSSPGADGKKITILTANMVRDFAFAISPEYNIESVKTESGTYINLYSYSNPENTAEILKTAAMALEYFGAKVAAYPYASLDIIETGLFLSGGMEYPGAAFIDSAYLNHPGNFSSLVHEIGHQWFYNIIGNNQIKDPWLDEGLTMAVQQGALVDAETLRQDMIFMYDTLAENLKKYETKTFTQDLSVYVSWPEYHAVNYTRAQLMFYALERKMGEEAFGRFLKTYYAKYAFGIAGRKDLTDTAEEVYGGSLADFFDGWMNDYSMPPLFDN